MREAVRRMLRRILGDKVKTVIEINLKHIANRRGTYRFVNARTARGDTPYISREFSKPILEREHFVIRHRRRVTKALNF